MRALREPAGCSLLRRSLPGWLTLGVATWAVVLSSCMAQSVVVVGETPLPPPDPVPMVAVQVNDKEGAPIVGALGIAGDSRVLSDDSGLIHVRWAGQLLPVSVEAEGFFPAALAVDGFQEEPFELTLRPVCFAGRWWMRPGSASRRRPFRWATRTRSPIDRDGSR